MKKMIVEIEAEEGLELDENAILDGLALIFMTETVGGIRTRKEGRMQNIYKPGKSIPVYAMDHIPEQLKNTPRLAETAKDHA